MNQPNPNTSEAAFAVEPASSPTSLSSAASPGDSVDAIAKARDLGELERIRRAVLAVGEATYHWDIASDKIVWTENVSEVIQMPDTSRISTGRGFADLLDPDNFTSRYDTVMRSTSKDDGEGIPFAIEYLLHTQMGQIKQSVWVEDCGRWYAGQNGQPAEVFGILRRIDDRHERDQELQYMGSCDPLTGMMNRGRLSEALADTMVKAEEENTSCAFLIAVINNLAVVNDAYGFDIADEVIVSVGNRLKRVVRAGDMIGRYSGAKFGVILADCTEEEIRIAAERFLSIARDSVFETERGPVWAMLSIGGVILPKFTSDANAAMAFAEEALAEAKRQSSDSFVTYRPSAERISVRGLNARCAAEIVSSLKEDRFTLAYQPIIDAKTGEVAMQEALLRMRCDDGDTVAAHHLIPIAEKLGLVRLIDRAVARMTVDALIAVPDLTLSLNVSGTTATDPRWFSQLTGILSETPGVAERVVLEITETVALQDLDQTIRFTRALREMGCRVAIDDFGAGYTSFRNLKELDIDMVKIDGSFCENLSENEENQYFVRSLIDLAQKFDLLTTAEWVQNERDAELLRSWGIDYLQGNLYGEATTDVPWASATESSNSDEPPETSAFDASMISIALQQTEENSEEADPHVAVSKELEKVPFEAKTELQASVSQVIKDDTAGPTTSESESATSTHVAVDQSDTEVSPVKVNALEDNIQTTQAAQSAPDLPMGNPDLPIGNDDIPQIILPTTEDLEVEPFVAVRMEDTAAGEMPQSADQETVEIPEPAAFVSSESIGQAGQGTSVVSAAEIAPAEVKLGSSLLKVAMSELDSAFGPKTETSPIGQTDLANAIAETFAANQTPKS